MRVLGRVESLLRPAPDRGARPARRSTAATRWSWCRARAATPRRWTDSSSSWPARSTTRACTRWWRGSSTTSRSARGCATRPPAETHHAYAGGLLEHTVAVASLCRETAQLHPRLDPDLLTAAALLHDLGRTETFTGGVTIAVSEQGRLLGHVLAGVRMIDAAARDTDLDQATLLAAASTPSPATTGRSRVAPPGDARGGRALPGKRARRPRRRGAFGRQARQTLKRTFSTSPSATT